MARCSGDPAPNADTAGADGDGAPGSETLVIDEEAIRRRAQRLIAFGDLQGRVELGTLEGAQTIVRALCRAAKG